MHIPYINRFMYTQRTSTVLRTHNVRQPFYVHTPYATRFTYTTSDTRTYTVLRTWFPIPPVRKLCYVRSSKTTCAVIFILHMTHVVYLRTNSVRIYCFLFLNAHFDSVHTWYVIHPADSAVFQRSHLSTVFEIRYSTRPEFSSRVRHAHVVTRNKVRF